jgi:hypothetical protein
MKYSICTLILSITSFLLHAQVGIGTTNPNAKLEVVASNQISPENTDGILIPKINNFPTINPIALQDGLMVFVTGLGVPTKGFYYWNNTTTSWIFLGGGVSTVNNGLNIALSGDIHLGGNLIENTTISQGIYGLAYNLNGTGDFSIQDNGIDKFEILDNGTSRFGGDVEWRDGSTVGELLGQLVDDGNDGRFLLRENGLISVDLDTNTQFIFNEQSLDRNFRIESNNNANMFFLDGGTDRVGIGSANPLETLQVNGGSRITTGLSIGNTFFGTYKLSISDATIPSAVIGNTAFNNVESGRLTFDENAPAYTTAGNTYCGFQIYHNGNSNTLNISSACTAETTIVTIQRNGNMGIGTPNPTANLSVNGTANKTGGGAWAVFSDKRLKKDISNYNEGLDLILKVKPVNYTYNSNFTKLFGEGDGNATTKVFQGVIAQDLQIIAPDMVTTVNTEGNNNGDSDGGSTQSNGGEFLQVDSSKFTYALINSVQEQQKQIDVQQKEIDELKLMVKQLLDKK